MSKLIFNFSSKKIKDIKDAKNLLGGKGFNLSEMGRMGLLFLLDLQYQQKFVIYFIKTVKN